MTAPGIPLFAHSKAWLHPRAYETPKRRFIPQTGTGAFYAKDLWHDNVIRQDNVIPSIINNVIPAKRGNSRGAKGGVWFSLIDKIQRPKTLNAAWAAVERNGGGAGSDHQGIEDFEKDLGGEIERFCEAL